LSVEKREGSKSDQTAKRSPPIVKSSAKTIFTAQIRREMVRTRRKTLSHTDLENFLSEVSSVTNEITKNVDTFFSLEPLHDPFLPPVPPPVKSDADIIREFCKVSLPPSLKSLSDFSFFIL
jgi:hypothetical protein